MVSTQIKVFTNFSAQLGERKIIGPGDVPIKPENLFSGILKKFHSNKAATESFLFLHGLPAEIDVITYLLE